MGVPIKPDTNHPEPIPTVFKSNTQELMNKLYGGSSLLFIIGIVLLWRALK